MYERNVVSLKREFTLIRSNRFNETEICYKS